MADLSGDKSRFKAPEPISGEHFDNYLRRVVDAFEAWVNDTLLALASRQHAGVEGERVYYQRGFGPGDGDSYVIPAAPATDVGEK